MVSATQYMISTNTCTFPSHDTLRKFHGVKPYGTYFRVRASSSTEEDCNQEECAPDKEVGKVSMEWLAGDKTKVSGTFPPKKKGWTGYVEKDTAGQTNIYSVEPAVYIAESAISSGAAGTSKEGAENNAAIAAGLAFISIAAASSVLLQVGKNSPPVQNTEYSGPSLSYYINKFKPPEIVEASLEIPPENSPSVELETSAPETSQAQVESAIQEEVPTTDVSSVSEQVPTSVEASLEIPPENSPSVELETSAPETSQAQVESAIQEEVPTTDVSSVSEQVPTSDISNAS